MSKYERAVKDKVRLFYISGFLCNYEKIWRNYEGKKKSTLKVQTPSGETQGFCLFNSFKGWWIRTKSRRLSPIPEVTLMRNTQSSFVFCDTVTLIDKLFRPLKTSWCPKHKTSGHRSADGSRSVPQRVMVTKPFKYEGRLCFCTWSCFSQQHCLHEKSWLDLVKHCVAWRCLSLLPFMPDTEGRWFHMRQGWHLPLGNQSRKGRELVLRPQQVTEPDRDRGMRSGVRRLSLIQTHQSEQKLFQSWTNPELGSSKIDMALLPKLRCAGSEQTADYEWIHHICSFCVLIHLFHTATWRVLEILLTV